MFDAMGFDMALELSGDQLAGMFSAMDQTDIGSRMDPEFMGQAAAMMSFDDLKSMDGDSAFAIST
ncbi:MAG: hypothetical protein CM1200mP22_06080 [Dehalococcoidia bacterium]|nr:MAG: hypothetical protein CM1200mP22_06080 [Dehalococcoidia bacterium]